MHDWRDTDFYKALKDQPWGQIRWEFLRRNPGYRRDWSMHGDPAFPLYWTMEGSEEKYARDLLLNPNQERLPEDWLEPICVPVVLERQDGNWVLSPATTSFVLSVGHGKDFVARIDPTLPIEEQADAIKAELAVWTQPFDDRRRLVGVYLQVLDAKEAQAASGPKGASGRITNKAIAAELSKTSGTDYDEQRVPGLVREAKARASKITGVPWQGVT